MFDGASRRFVASSPTEYAFRELLNNGCDLPIILPWRAGVSITSVCAIRCKSGRLSQRTRSSSDVDGGCTASLNKGTKPPADMSSQCNSREWGDRVYTN